MPLPSLRPLLVVFLSLASSATMLAQREVMSLDKGWLFLKGDADIVALSDSWNKVSVPHTWNALDGQAGFSKVSDKQETEAEAKAATEAWNAKHKFYGQQGGGNDPHMKSKYYRGVCWYEHPIEIPAEWKGKKRIFVRFGAAGTVARTYINKELLGEHRGGFTAFCYEITDLVKFGSSNELRVQVDNSHREDLPPLSGDFNVCGGLYRQVELIVTDKICISPLDYASSGVYLTTESIDPANAIVEVKTIVSNGNRVGPPPKKKESQVVEPSEPWSADKTNVTVQTEITDASGRSVASGSTNLSVPLEATEPVVQNLSISDPHLWNGRKDPYLYLVKVSLIFEGKNVDQIIQQLGLRTVGIGQEKGFLLNGQPYPIHGVNRHQELINKGWVLTPDDEERDHAIIREMGTTAIRDAHYPQSENWHRINDREGILLWNEITMVNETRNTRAFWANSEEIAREMVHQLYNHPSIAWWGMFNELHGKEIPPSNTELSHLQSVIKEIDPRRLVVSASDEDDQSFNRVPDQIARNTYPGWYQRGVEKMDVRLDHFFKEVGKRFAVSEYGAGGNVVHHTEGPPVQPQKTTDPFHPEEWQAYVHEQDWSRMRDNPKLWGSFLWCMFDFSVSGRNEGNTPFLNDKGMVTHDRRIRKDAYFFYKANWNPEPMIYITSRRSVNRTQPTTDVKVYSNCPEVELSVNGKSCGSVRPDELRIARWSGVALQPGKNEIKVTAKSGEKSLEDSCVWKLAQP